MSEPQFSQGAQGASVEQIKAIVEQRVQAAVEAGSRRMGPEGAAPEIAEPEGWWNIYAYGPFQAVPPNLFPYRVIKEGETFSIATVIWFRPFGFPVSPCQMITNLGCEIVLDYCTGDLCKWTQAPAAFRPAAVKIPLVPNQCWYVDVQQFNAAAGTAGLYEMHITGRVTGCAPGAKPPLAGFVTAVRNLDPDVFYPPAGSQPPNVPPPPSGQGAGWQYDIPIRFQIYP